MLPLSILLAALSHKLGGGADEFCKIFRAACAMLSTNAGG
jgi:hypothetical protein